MEVLMERRDFIKAAIGSVIMPMGILNTQASEFRSSKPNAKLNAKPNIIFILSDDFSAKELTCYGGNGISTPTLDRMANEGVMFKTAWTSPVCGPSRAMLLTGRYPARTGFYGNSVYPTDSKGQPKKLSDGNILMGQEMQKSGYKTAMFGKDHHGGDPQKDYGFDEYCIVRHWPGYDGLPQTKENGYNQWYWHPALIANGKGIPTGPQDFGPDIEVDHLNNFVTKHKDVPFFIFWPTHLPHMELNSAKWNYVDVPELDASGKKTGNKVKGNLKTNVEYIDHLIGRIIDNLNGLGIRDNTIIMFSGDNGTAGYGKGQPETEKGPRVPFIVDGPSIVKQISPCDELIDFSDVFPTMLELAGGSLPKNYIIDGHSFAPLLLGKKYNGREWIFAQIDTMRWLRDKRWLLDANGNFYDCGNERDETKGYRDVTDSDDPEVIKARKRFQTIMESVPQTDYNDPATKERWKKFFNETRK
jgi:arylsulfatase A